MTPPNDARDGDWLEDLLRDDAREHAAQYVTDAGFSARVAAALPPRPDARPGWRRPVVAILWGLAGAGTVMSFPDFAIGVGREAFRLLAAQPVTLPQIATALVAVGVATWAAAAYALKND